MILKIEEGDFLQNIIKFFTKRIYIFIFITILLVLFIYRFSKNDDTFIPVLMYHNVDENIDFKKITYSIKSEKFEKHMRILKKKGYNTITTTELNDHIYENKPLPKKPILLTFDDGKTNNYQYVYPLLKDLGMKGTIFCIVHTAQDHENEEYMDWKKLREMHDASIMDIQSHTYDLHHKVDKTPAIFTKKYKENNSDYKDRVINDFKISKELIEKNIGNKVVALAYPYGKYNSEVEELAKEIGYKQTFTTDIGLMRRSDSPYLIKRLNVDGLCSDKRLIIEIKLLELLARLS